MNTKHEVFSLLVAGSAVCCCAAAILVIKNPPERQLEVRVLRVTNTVYVPAPPAATQYTPAPQYVPVPMPMYPPTIPTFPLPTNMIYGMPLYLGKTNIVGAISGPSMLYTNGTAVTNIMIYTNNTMTVLPNTFAPPGYLRVMTENLLWTNIYVGKGN